MEESRDVKTVVLRKSIDEAGAMEIIEQKKAEQFGSIFSRIKKEDIHVGQPELYYECMLRVSGTYAANYYRTRIHTVTVPSNVREVVLGDRVFPINEKSKIKKIVSGKHGKNKADMELEEHVFINEEGKLTFDYHGAETGFPYKVNSETVESYSSAILEGNKVRDIKIPYDSAVQRLEQMLKGNMEDGVRDIQEEFALQDIVKVYIPIIEARLNGPEKEGIIRVDAVRKKTV